MKRHSDTQTLRHSDTQTLRHSVRSVFILSFLIFLSACTADVKMWAKLGENLPSLSPGPGTPSAPESTPPSPLSSFPMDLMAPLFQDDFNRPDEVLTANVKWLGLSGTSGYITSEEVNTNNGGLAYLLPNNPVVFPDLDKVYLESAVKMSGVSGQTYAILPYTDLNTYTGLMGCVLEYQSGSVVISAGNYLMGTPTQIAVLNNYPINTKSYFGCEVDAGTGSIAVYWNSVLLGKIENLAVPSAADSMPLMFAQGTGIIIDDVKAFPSFVEGRTLNDGRLRIYNTPYASYFSSQLSSFHLQGYCQDNGAQIRVKDADSGTFESSFVTCTNNEFSLALDLTTSPRFPMGANQIRVEYYWGGSVEEFWWHFVRQPEPAVTVAFGNPSPTGGTYSTTFSYILTYQNTSSISLGVSDVQLHGNTDGCQVAVENTSSIIRTVRLSNCQSVIEGSQVWISLKAGTAVNGDGIVAGTFGPSAKVSLSNAVVVQFASLEDIVEEGQGVNIQTLPLTLDLPSPVDVTIEYKISDYFTTAQNPLDFNLPSRGTVVIPAGQTSGVISYQYNGNASSEGPKALQVSILKVQALQIATKIGSNFMHRRIIVDEEKRDVQVVVGGPWSNSFACVLDSEGGVRCWGASNNTMFPSSTPIAVAGSDHFSQISAGSGGGCGLTTTGAIKCWSGFSAPSLLDDSVVYTSVSGSSAFGCGLTSLGGIRCWGTGILGDGAASRSSWTAPVTVSGSDSYSMVSVGSHACGLTQDGIIKCWGFSWFMGNGGGSTIQQLVPTAIDDTDRYKFLSVGSAHSCGIRLDGRLKCWGGNNFYARLGDGTTIDRYVPTLVNDTDLYKDVTAGDISTCGTTVGGSIKCWGWTSSGFGSKGVLVLASPVSLNEMFSYKSLARECGVTEEGVTRCWGFLGVGSPLIYGNNIYRQTITALPLGNGYSSVSLGSVQCAVDSSGQPYCWGSNDYGQLGIGFQGGSFDTPMAINDSEPYLSVESGSTIYGLSPESCGITTGHKLKCWGNNNYSSITRPSPVDPSESYSAVTFGNGYKCALTLAGQMKCWGSNQPGSGLSDVTETPTEVDENDSYTAVSSEQNHSCAINSSGFVKCWGENQYGQLGTGLSQSEGLPTPINDSTSYQMISVGRNHSCGLTQSGQVKCWGDNQYGQLGDGTKNNRSTPTPVYGSEVYKYINAGGNSTCGITTGNVTKCWGHDWKFINTGDHSTVYPTIFDSGVEYASIKASFSGACGITTAGQLRCQGVDTLLGVGEVPWSFKPAFLFP